MRDSLTAPTRQKIARTSPKTKKCKVCEKTFEARSSLQVVCSIGCATLNAGEARRKKERKEYREAKEKLKSRADYVREAQAAFNAYIRERDKVHPCISCGRHHQGQYHAGHFRTTKAAPELRFNELNVHKQCSVCNNHLSGNIVEYRISLVRRIGLDKVEWLEGHHEPQHYTVDDLIDIRDTYKAKLKAIKREL